MSRRILVVDDELDVCIALRSVIEENGFEVDTFVDSFKALENFRSSLYDLLILDIKMPKMNGFELYRRMKKIDHNIKVFSLKDDSYTLTTSLNSSIHLLKVRTWLVHPAFSSSKLFIHF